MSKHNAIVYPVEQIRTWIAEDWTHQEITDELQKTLDKRVTTKLIYKVCKKHGIKCQRTGPRNGARSKSWLGGVNRDKHGYVNVYCPDHPSCVDKNKKRAEKANGKFFGKHYYVREHRLVMEKRLGRYLLDNEVVHHKNGIKDDNRLENLEVFQTNAEHLAVDLKGKCPKWTAAGKLKILIAVARRSARVRQSKGLDAQEQLQKIDRLIAELQALVQPAS